jgi:hypothetical protein
MHIEMKFKKKLPLIGKGQTHCPVCGRRLINDIGKIALYDDFNVESDVLSHDFLYCRHKKCRIFYANISKKTKLESLAAPNHIITVHQKYVTMKERRSYVNNLFLAPETRETIALT